MAYFIHFVDEGLDCIEKSKKQNELQLLMNPVWHVHDGKIPKEEITDWINVWEKNNWKTKDKKNVKNVDLWKKLKELSKSNQIEWHWIKGHSGDPMNDLADRLAKEATPI